jgi:hypothetical protein
LKKHDKEIQKMFDFLKEIAIKDFNFKDWYRYYLVIIPKKVILESDLFPEFRFNDTLSF